MGPRVTAMVVLCIAVASITASDVLMKFLECHLCENLEPEGNVGDCSCDFATVNEAIENLFAPVLKDLQHRTFFRYFKVNLERECPFWTENHECSMEGCTICECDSGEIPRNWLEIDKKGSNAHGWVSSSSNHTATAREEHLSRVDQKPLEFFNRWTIAQDTHTWTVNDDHEENMTYFNLNTNPERFTGYSGDSARKVWGAIHKENCFGGNDDTCYEKRVFYRLMSGLQSSISTQIAREYYWPESGWGVNMELFVKAVGSHPDRLNNLYFTFLCVLRAVSKARDALLEHDYNTGNETDDAYTRELMHKLIDTQLPRSGGEITEDGWRRAAQMCLKGFDESNLFQVQLQPSDDSYSSRLVEKEALHEELRQKFLNVSRIMDCVGCEKCRLWGKLQTLGLGVSLKILLSEAQNLRSLPRNEVIALINTLGQLAKSVEFAARSRDLELQYKLLEKVPVAAIVTLIVVLVSYLRQRKNNAAVQS